MADFPVRLSDNAAAPQVDPENDKNRPTAVIEARIFQRLLCSETMKVNANIENPVVIKRILDHLDQRAGRQPLALRPLARAPPLGELPGLTE